MTRRGTISKVVPFVVARVASAAGADAAVLLESSGISADEAPSADEHISVEAYLEVWRRAMQQVGDAALPVRVASAFQLEDNEVFGFLAMTCATIRQAFERTVSYSTLYCHGATWEMREDAEGARMIWRPWPGDPQEVGYRAAMDYSVADMANAVCRLGQGKPRPLAVHLVHAKPPMAEGFVDHYGVEPVFGSAFYELVYPPSVPELPIVSFNSRLRDYFDEECRRLVENMGSGAGIAEQVRKKLIRTMDGGDTAMEVTARTLGMSARSLQRRLADEGTGYSDLLADVRAEFAKRYLARGTISASEVAYLIGFTEPPAFFKAFKRWTGMTPREFQQRATSTSGGSRGT